jgi:tetratricopeptide (TPR) repeat protein
MSHSFFDFLLSSSRPQSQPAKTEEIAFDDESLESILYGEQLPGPTPANLYSRGIEFTRNFTAALGSSDIQKIAAVVDEFAGEKVPLSIGCCFELTAIMESLIPNYPCPVLEFDLSAFGPLLTGIWELALQAANPILQDKAGSALYRWFEHHERYEEARQVLTKLIEIQKSLHDRKAEAVYLNNFAFEYLLEKRWGDAAPLFEKSAEIFKETGQDLEHANSWSNYWTCRFECDDLHQMEAAEEELRAHARTLSSKGSWHSRKPFILLAKLKEKQGDIRKAIKFVKKAILASQKSRTRFTELDGEYLDRLKLMRKN